MKPFRLKSGDTLKPLRLTLNDLDDDGEIVSPADLTEAVAVYFNMRNEAGDLVVDHGEAEVLDAETGDVQYNWALVDTLTPGKFKGEFEVNYPGSPTQTVTYPNDSDIPIVIREALA